MTAYYVLTYIVDLNCVVLVVADRDVHGGGRALDVTDAEDGVRGDAEAGDGLVRPPQQQHRSPLF